MPARVAVARAAEKSGISAGRVALDISALREDDQATVPWLDEGWVSTTTWEKGKEQHPQPQQLPLTPPSMAAKRTHSLKEGPVTRDMAQSDIKLVSNHSSKSLGAVLGGSSPRDKRNSESSLLARRRPSMDQRALSRERLHADIAARSVVLECPEDEDEEEETSSRTTLEPGASRRRPSIGDGLLVARSPDDPRATRRSGSGSISNHERQSQASSTHRPRSGSFRVQGAGQRHGASRGSTRTRSEGVRRPSLVTEDGSVFYAGDAGGAVPCEDLYDLDWSLDGSAAQSIVKPGAGSPHKHGSFAKNKRETNQSEITLASSVSGGVATIMSMVSVGSLDDIEERIGSIEESAPRSPRGVRPMDSKKSVEKSIAESEEMCLECGAMFLVDAQFCRMCGTRRPPVAQDGISMLKSGDSYPVPGVGRTPSAGSRSGKARRNFTRDTIGTSDTLNTSATVVRVHDPPSRDRGVLKKIGSSKDCIFCGRPYIGFGDACSTCRKIGRSISAHQCITCGSFFAGFVDQCEDCTRRKPAQPVSSASPITLSFVSQVEEDAEKRERLIHPVPLREEVAYGRNAGK